jgi:hypothetical protein
VPIAGWDRLTQNALRFAYTLSHEIHAVHVTSAANEPNDETRQRFRDDWERYALQPARGAGLPPAELVILDSPFRRILQPILDYVQSVERENPGRQIAVVLSELVEHHWYHYFLHNQRAELLKTWLLLRGDERIVIVNIPWYLKS